MVLNTNSKIAELHSVFWVQQETSQYTLKHVLTVQDTLTKWQNFMSERKQFSDWLSQKEIILGNMQMVESADPKELIDLVKTLKVRTSYSIFRKVRLE